MLPLASREQPPALLRPEMCEQPRHFPPPHLQEQATKERTTARLRSSPFLLPNPRRGLPVHPHRDGPKHTRSERNPPFTRKCPLAARRGPMLVMKMIDVSPYPTWNASDALGSPQSANNSSASYEDLFPHQSLIPKDQSLGLWAASLRSRRFATW